MQSVYPAGPTWGCGTYASDPPFPLVVLWVLLHVFCGERSSLAGSSLFIGGGSTGSCDADVLLEGGLRSLCSAVLAGLLLSCK